MAMTRHSLMSPMAVAATVAHEMRTPLASIRMQADALSELLPEVSKLYQLARAHGLLDNNHDSPADHRLLTLTRGMSQQVARLNVVIDMMLASSRMEKIDSSTFERHSMQACVTEAVASYPFQGKERDRVSVDVLGDYEFFGSDTLMVCVLFNLIKNSLYAIQSVDKGEIKIAVESGDSWHALTFTDTASGIPAAILPRIFDAFFTTKGSGAGIGLAFCQRAVGSFGGRMQCESVEGRHTTFIMEFPRLDGPEPRSQDMAPETA
jgi:two-component system, CAI-1 autoinducer sensor kinase/phosphatase CqsS